MDQANSSVRWKFENSGEFTVRSAYAHISKESNTGSRIWSSIWKLPILQRTKSFLWLAIQDKLLSNEVRVKRHMASDSSCACCGDETESLLHILRDCKEAKDLWIGIVKPSMFWKFFSTDMDEWLQLNILKPHLFGGDKWDALFATICWHLWNRRNCRTFGGSLESNPAVLWKSKSLIMNLSQSSRKLAGVNLQGTPSIDLNSKGRPPPPNWFKLNIDGAFSPLAGAGSGGILRDSTGFAHGGFLINHSDVDSLAAELRALAGGLEFAWNKGIRKVIVETDASDVQHLLGLGDTNDHRHKNIIQLARTWLERNWEVALSVIPRSQNTVADCLAKQAIGIEFGFYPILQFSPDVRTLVQNDCNFSLIPT